MCVCACVCVCKTVNDTCKTSSRIVNIFHQFMPGVKSRHMLFLMLLMMHCAFDTWSFKNNIFKLRIWEGEGSQVCTLFIMLKILDDP